MKRIFFLLIFLLPVSSVLSDISNLKVNGQIRYFSTLVDDLGTRYDDTRPGPALDLHFTYPINESLSIKSFNYVINYNDTTSGDETANIRYNQRLGFMYKLGGTIFTLMEKFYTMMKIPKSKSTVLT